MKLKLSIIILTLFSIVFLSLGLRGKYTDKLLYQDDLSTDVGGPYEASNSTSRYALVRSIVDDRSLFLSEELARFSTPDLVYDNGKFSSIFLPGVSFLAVPLYYLGGKVGAPQIFTYLLNPILGLISLFLIVKISMKLGSSKTSSYLGAFLFLFATNALPYTQTLTQHIPTVTLLLGGILNSFYRRSWGNNIILGLLYGYAIFIDIPNLFIFLPLILFVFIKHFSLKSTAFNYYLDLKKSVFGLLIGILPIMLIFGLYNKAITGSYTSIGQSIGRVDYEEARNNDVATPPTTTEAIFERDSPLDTRKAIQGIYILIFSDERGIFYYQPVIAIGLIGLYLLFKKTKFRAFSVMILSIITSNILVYSIFGDPWGGWSFGPRYLIPSTAVISICIATALSLLKKNIIFNIIVSLAMIYSIYVNVLGLITTNSIPPKQEANALISPIPYTYQYNIDLLKTKHISSLFYDYYLDNKIDPSTYFYIYFVFVSTIGTGLLISNIYRIEKDQNETKTK